MADNTEPAPVRRDTGRPRNRRPHWLRSHAIDTRPLATPVFRRLFVGQSASYVGTALTEVAVPVQVFAISHSSLDVGLVGVAGLLPLLVFGLYGGAVADAVDRRTLYFWASASTWVITVALLAQTLLDVRSVGLILGLTACQAAGFAITSSVGAAITPRIVEPGLVPAANTLIYSTGTVAGVVGPLLAGLLVTGTNGFAWAYGIDAVLFTAALYARRRLPRLPPEGGGTTLGLRSVADGLKFIAARPVLVMSFAVDICAMVLAMPTALFPAVAASQFPGFVGLLYAAIPLGSVLAALGSGWIGRVRRQTAVLSAAVVLWGLAVALSGLAGQLWLVMTLLVVAGAADLVSAVLRQTIMQTYVPDRMRGRLQGVYTVVVTGGPRLGDLRAGATAVVLSAGLSWSIGGIACAVIVATVAPLVRTFWTYDASTQIAADDEARPAQDTS
jgi:MFS family permease